MANKPAAISGTFSDYKLVKTRGCLQLVIEVPVEQQALVFEALGFPMPGQEIHVAVARLDVGVVEQRPPRVMTEGERAVQRAALLAKDIRFQKWVNPTYPSETSAVAFIRERCCEGGSRKTIATNFEQRALFEEMVYAYEIETGLKAAPR